ncbi:heme o synthase [Mesorhizobium kowhaii]|uniref:Protoheme IX farnesyltransferase n=1 Tax=Mesorhizobium kowhaii TaxID=1300272 RepID=A0A2W7CEL2_9HYPH|nr:heme o synthase [Mesorhizobium kowhaii]PZV34923.1 protoheme IX farnesyltransferase [Mesorhizobium kowhaii]
MSVKTIADQFSQARDEAGILHIRAIDFCMLMKPRVMVLAVFTAFVGLTIAPGNLHPLNAFVAVLAIAAGAGAAGALNMWYDADIDAVMTRTAMRPVPRGKVSPIEALVFGIVLAVAAIAVLALATNVTAAALLALAILFYVIVYTAWLKRLTPQNIVIGGAAGALPPVIGWAAATAQIGIEPLVLFFIIFLWTPPHFWALALNRSDEYARAGVPMLPVVAGRAATTRQILIYCALLSAASVLPWALGFAGPIYGATAIACGANLVALAIRLYSSDKADRRAPGRLFAFSIFYLFVLFAALLVDHADQPQRSTPVSGSRTVHAEGLPRAALAAGTYITIGTDEV